LGEEGRWREGHCAGTGEAGLDRDVIDRLWPGVVSPDSLRAAQSRTGPVDSALELRMLEPRRGGDGVSPGRSVAESWVGWLY
jgi:hypothetical protein